MIVSVNPSHIANGTKGSATSCPIALAVKEQHGVETISVSKTCMAFYRDNKLECHNLPKEASRFIFDFDHGAPVQPFTFESKE